MNHHLLSITGSEICGKSDSIWRRSFKCFVGIRMIKFFKNKEGEMAPDLAEMSEIKYWRCMIRQRCLLDSCLKPPFGMMCMQMTTFVRLCHISCYVHQSCYDLLIIWQRTVSFNRHTYWSAHVSLSSPPKFDVKLSWSAPEGFRGKVQYLYSRLNHNIWTN